MTDRTLTELAELSGEIKKTKQAGYAFDNGEFHDDIRCLAAAVFNIDNEIVAAIGVTGPATQFPESRREDVKSAVLKASETLSKKMGATVFKIR